MFYNKLFLLFIKIIYIYCIVVVFFFSKKKFIKGIGFHLFDGPAMHQTTFLMEYVVIRLLKEIADKEKLSISGFDWYRSSKKKKIV